MGTSVETVVFADSGEPLDVWAHRFAGISIPADPTRDVVVHITRTPAGCHDLIWVGIAGDRGETIGLNEEAAWIASRFTAQPVIVAWYSDTTGMAGFKVFEKGACLASDDTESSPKSDIVDLFCRPFGDAYPGSEIGYPDDVYDLWYGPDATEESYVVGDRNLLFHTIERTTHPGPESPSRTAV